ncbi:Transcriptional regulatory protein RcsB [compost metagenome]
MTIRVVVADDHPVVIFGVRQILKSSRHISVVAEASDPKMLMEQLESASCDVLITDFSMPGSIPDGLVMLRNIRSAYPKLRVIVLTMLENPGLQLSMLKAGALTVLNKRNELSKLPQVITAAYEGRYSRSNRAAEPLGGDGAGSEVATLVTPRELEVVRLYVNGMTMTDIAQHLNRSIKTVSTQKISAIRKLGLGGEAELFAYASKHGLMEA